MLTKELQSGWESPIQDEIGIPQLHPVPRAGPTKVAFVGSLQ